MKCIWISFIHNDKMGFFIFIFLMRLSFKCNQLVPETRHRFCIGACNFSKLSTVISTEQKARPQTIVRTTPRSSPVAAGCYLRTALWDGHLYHALVCKAFSGWWINWQQLTLSVAQRANNRRAHTQARMIIFPPSVQAVLGPLPLSVTKKESFYHICERKKW